MQALVIRVGVYPHRSEQTTAWEAAALAEAGVAYRFLSTATPSQQIAAVREADVIFAGGQPWPAEVLAAADRCRLLVSCGVGVDRLDIAAASAARVMVCNMPDLCTDEVADHALALLLACVRKVLRLHARVAGGRWDRALLEPMPRLRGKTLGLLGLGRIGQAVAARASGFGLRLLAHDAHVPPSVAADLGVEVVALERLLRESDLVSCHLPLTPETTGLLDERAFRLMKPSAHLVNTARGRIVDEAALARALREGWIAGAGLDVLAQEPPPADHPLLRMENVVVTPHASGFSDEVVDRIPRLAVAEALAVLRGGTPRAMAWINRSAWQTPG